jgi:chorismate mutase/prephenate dehydratase
MTHESSTTPSAELRELREKIDALDAQVLTLLAERCSLAERVIDAKDSTADTIRHPQREESLLRERITQGRAQGLDGQFVMRVFHELIAESVRVQQGVLQHRANPERAQSKTTTVAFQGIDGTFSHLGGRAFFARTPSNEPSFVGYPSFEAVVRAVESGTCDYGVLPIENTTAGAINDVYDLLLHSRLAVVGEEKLRVSYGLIGTAGVSPLHITRILCSPLAVAECSAFLATIPECSIEYVTDSALAVKCVKEGKDPSVAAIASTDTAPLFGLAVLSDTIANHTESFTRYVILSRSPITVDSRVPSKTSIVLHTTNQPGALVEALSVFQEHGINLTKLESRPVPGNSWEEMFYIDFAGNLGDENVKGVLGELTRKARFIKVLGCYPRCDIEATEVTDAHELAQELATTTSV